MTFDFVITTLSELGTFILFRREPDRGHISPCTTSRANDAGSSARLRHNTGVDRRAYRLAAPHQVLTNWLLYFARGRLEPVAPPCSSNITVERQSPTELPLLRLRHRRQTRDQRQRSGRNPRDRLG